MKAKINSRKLWIFIILFLVGTTIWYLSADSVFNDWVSYVAWIFGIYAGGNGIEHGANAYKQTIKD